MKKNIDKLKNNKLAILCVGASPYDERAFAEIKAHNLTGDLRDIPLFYGRGAWNESKMKFMDRALCKMLQKSIAKKDPAHIRAVDESSYVRGRTKLRLDR